MEHIALAQSHQRALARRRGREDLAEQTGGAVSVVSVDGLDVEMGSTRMPRFEYAEMAQKSADGVAARIRESGRRGRRGDVRPGKVVPGVLHVRRGARRGPDPRSAPPSAARSPSACSATSRSSSCGARAGR